MTLKLEGDLNILKMYLHTKNEVARLMHSKLVTVDEICVANEKILKYLSTSQSNVTNFQPLLAFTMGHIPTKSYHVLMSTFQDFVQTDTAKNNTCSQHSWHAGTS